MWGKKRGERNEDQKGGHANGIEEGEREKKGKKKSSSNKTHTNNSEQGEKYSREMSVGMG